MASKALPTPEELRQLLDYDPETGAFTWRERSPDLFVGKKYSADRLAATWNGNFAGTAALTNHSNGYLKGRILGRSVKAHRAAWAIYYNEWPTGHIDHINHNRADNRIANLRIVTRAENMRNSSRASNNTSGVTGVSWCKKRGKWVARIIRDGRLKHLGYFDDILLAAQARQAANTQFGFHRNHGL